jgi:hypothetical protein
MELSDPSVPLGNLRGQSATSRDLKAVNTFDQPTRVTPQRLDAPQPGRTMTFKLPAASYLALSA